MALPAPEIGTRAAASRTALAAALVCVSYYLGARLGLALTFQPHPISPLSPPNAILLAALLLSPVRSWPWLLLAAFPAHLAAELQSGVPAAMVLGRFLTNCSEALIGAVAVRWLIRGPLRFDSFHHVCVFVLFGAVLAAFASSFLDAGLVRVMGWGESRYWELWRTRFFSNLLGNLTLVPVIVTWADDGFARLRRAPWDRWLEGCLQAVGLLAVSVVVFTRAGAAPGTTAVLLYAPVPFLLWAAVRLGPIGTSTSLLVLLLLAVWGAIHELGPFVSSSALDSALSIQLFLIVLSIPLLFLTAVIDERERSKAALRSSEERFAKAFLSSPDAMVITRTRDGRIVEVNERWERLFGQPRAQAVGNTIWELGMFASASDADALRGAISSRGRVADLELALRSQSGELRQTVIGAETAELDGEPCFIAIIRDLTDQRHAERELQERQRELAHLGRVATLGELSGSLAHEISQPLTAMQSNAEAAQRMLGQQPIDIEEVREILSDIVQQNTRVGEVIRRLRALFKKGETQFQPLDLNEVTNEALELAHGDLTAHGVSLTARLGEGLPMVDADRIQLQQVLLNLIHNACEAMSDVRPGERRLWVRSELTAENMVQMSVSDTGPGVSPELRERLFQPFFTTKPNGLGLGLSITRSIISAHRGRLWVSNHPVRGAMFCFTLPAKH
jgi:PAS domain S-box-containing protein